MEDPTLLALPQASIAEHEWYDKGLNDEQRVSANAHPRNLVLMVAHPQNAVSCIALQRFPVPYLISGPPGTGKTRSEFLRNSQNPNSLYPRRTVVEAVLQILWLQPESCILLCAPSNPATDTLAARLRHRMKPGEMFRLNDQNRTFAEVPNHIMQYCREKKNPGLERALTFESTAGCRY
jgi:hypothetical protein